MEAFLADLFDLDGVDPRPFLTPAGALSHAALMADPRLLANAAFRAVWREATGGALPSARCYRDFVAARGAEAGADPEAVVQWLVQGPFRAVSGTDAFVQRVLAPLRDGRFRESARRLASSREALHRAVVEKLLDRHAVRSSDEGTARLMRVPLPAARAEVAGGRPSAAAAASWEDRLLNPVSHVAASRDEEEEEEEKTPTPNDALKRRAMRDLHFWRRALGKPYVTFDDALEREAEAARAALEAPWAVAETVAARVEAHMPSFWSACVRLHSCNTGNGNGNGTAIRPPVRGVPASKSLLLLFDADAEPDGRLAAIARAAGYGRVFRATTARAGAAAAVDVHAPDGPTQHQDIAYSLFFGAAGAEDWTFPLLSATLRRHLAAGGCPLATGAPMDAALLVDRCVLRVALARGLLHASPPSTPWERSGEGEFVIAAFDNRPRPAATVLSVLLALSSLREPGRWGVRFFCSRANRAWVEATLGRSCPWAVADASLPHLNAPDFAVEEHYNDALLDPDTWRRLRPARLALVVQDDGLLLRRGLEGLDGGRVLEPGRVRHLGARWAPDWPSNAPLKRRVPCLVGNGGLSLRDVEECARVAGAAPVPRRLFHDRLQRQPEDAFFAEALNGGLDEEGARALAALADAFAAEEIPCPQALGFHKPFPYVPVAVTHALMQNILRAEGGGVYTPPGE